MLYFDISFVFRENIYDNSYVYLEEVLKLPDFDLHPKTPIDIEKPSSVSQNHTVFWSVPIKALINGNEWISNVTHLSNQNEFPQTISSEARLLDRIKIPAKNVTNVCFGSDNNKKLLVTYARSESSYGGVYEVPKYIF